MKWLYTAGTKLGERSRMGRPEIGFAQFDFGRAHRGDAATIKFSDFKKYATIRILKANEGDQDSFK